MHTALLVFGLTGDLMRKKGIPALFTLWKEKRLPPDFRVVGLSRNVWTREKIGARIAEALGERAPEEFVDLFSIFSGAGENETDILNLNKEHVLEAGALYAYLCISPELYGAVIRNLRAAGLLEKLSALLIEKPFGTDLASAQSLQNLLAGYGFPEEKTYRIDHFLAKEAMDELSSLPSEEVESIEVYLNEPLGVEARGALYDPVGALRDVGQNHLLEATAAALGDRRFALEALHTLTPQEIKTHTRRGQHEGYREIDGVAPNSQTETYFRIESHFELMGRRIPLLIESGKRLPSRREAVVTLSGGERVIPFEAGRNEYEALFSDAFAGDRSRFVSMREVEALWRFIDPIEKEWRANAVPLLSYKPDLGEILKS